MLGPGPTSVGHRIHRRTHPGKPAAVGTESLTEREHQVARLIVDRKTNPEIAAELFLSRKTVETHVRNMLRKLEVDSRVAIARANRTSRPRRTRASALILTTRAGRGARTRRCGR